MNYLNEFQEHTSNSDLKKSSDRLKQAKIHFGEMVSAHYPDWTGAIEDPISFQQKQYAKSLEALKQKRMLSEEDFRRQIDSYKEVMRAQEEYLQEVQKEYQASLERDKILSEAAYQHEEKKA
eukprot:CAMPEP_0202433962 /NCGR_PEP_ID=MMETSP1345-20130828/13739_1 /ASSEMBLY_ACC=CAM_ASM_000843 /TAXON_ID=342563 /ORGANISM="Fabrea Fabrea salina" /LENGTH=121 /DNA_ID=CAMNT_0049046447 /DNA_START=192 /DNA_END=554 /DNA_ORIENTATION=+